MSKRNLRLDTLEPDILLKVEWLREPKQKIVSTPMSFPDYYDPVYYEEYAPFYFFGRPDNMVYKTENIQFKEVEIEYSHGGARLTVFDGKKGGIIWQGVAQGDLYDPKIMYQDLHPAIHKLMKKFPIPQ